VREANPDYCAVIRLKQVGPKGKVIGIVHREEGKKDVEDAMFVDEVIVGQADQAIDLLEKVERRMRVSYATWL